MKSILAFAVLMAMSNACSDSFLEIPPNGLLDGNVLATEDGIDKLLIASYSMLDGVSSNGFGWEAASSNWVYGSIRGMEANKGTDSGDQPDINPIQTFSESATNPYLNVKWRSMYEGIARVNSALTVIPVALSSGAITAAQADSFTKQARTLRGFFHFEAWRMWSKADGSGIVYMDENTDPLAVTNEDTDVADKILADLDAGTSLPNNMTQVGRFNGTVAKALKAKALMQMKKDYAGAKTLLQDIIATGTAPDGSAIGLEAKYGDIFDAANRNGVEAIYTIQYSVNDGSGGWNGGWGEVLNFPYKSGASPGGCCGFFQPSQEFVNSFRTSGGLPMARTNYNTGADLRDQGLPSNLWEPDDGDDNDPSKATDKDEYKKDALVTRMDPATPYLDKVWKSLIGTDASPNVGNDPLTSPAAWQLVWTEDNTYPIDPRLDLTVGRRGIPYLDWGKHTGQDWIRDQTYAGPYSPKKQVYKKSQEGQLTEVGNWTSGWTANGYRLIRFADIKLLLAECLIETNDLAGALTHINDIRTRAANPAGFVYESDGTTPAANYNIANYTSFASQDAARQALRMERKLELGLEGHRYFDLQRWGIVQSELTEILNYEKGRAWGSALYGSGSVGAEDVNYPIPQTQIDLMGGRLKQNR